MPLVTGWTPQGLVGDMEEDAADLSEEAMFLDIRGGASLSCHDGSVSSNKGSTRTGGHWAP